MTIRQLDEVQIGGNREGLRQGEAADRLMRGRVYDGTGLSEEDIKTSYGDQL